MEKVKLPREVAEALDKSKHMGSVAIMAHIARYSDPDAMVTTLELSRIHSFYKANPYLIASALVNGYEVDQTPEEQAIQWMIKRKCLAPGFSEHDVVMAIKSILNGPKCQ